MVLTILITACGAGSNEGSVVEGILGGSSKTEDVESIEEALMPLQFDSTKVILHCSGTLLEYERSRSSSLKSGYDSTEPSVQAHSAGDVIRGYLNNVYFDDYGNNSQRFLTDKKDILIRSLEYQREVKKALNKDLLLYWAHDEDSNKDGKITNEDRQGLYISNLDGSSFVRLTPKSQIHRGSKMMNDVLRFYFATYEDVNSNDKFDSEDKAFYYYIDFKNDPFKIVEYYPIAK